LTFKFTSFYDPVILQLILHTLFFNGKLKSQMKCAWV